jgi:hypothetical protein
MPPLADCYVLVDSRRRRLVEDFLDHFLSRRQSCASAFEFPQYSESPAHIFLTATEALSFIEAHPEEGHALYWANEDNDEPPFVMVFPTVDGQMIFGLSCDWEDATVADSLLERMKRFLGVQSGYITFEKPPPGTAKEFREIAESVSKE